jgi:hypothetical protein
MDVLLWGAVCATIMMVLAVGGVLVATTRRITNAEAAANDAKTRADTAALAVLANAAKVEKVASELSEHREDTAKDYVSYQHMTNLENRLVEAIGRLGDRLDKLFTARAGAN